MPQLDDERRGQPGRLDGRARFVVMANGPLHRPKLPGIEGMILSIGVAADANIIIFERIREEYRAGRSVVQSITIGCAFDSLLSPAVE